ncbi:hypothetical protein [Thermosynechococcus sp.]|uniref:ParB N-terminal domain-containing protein n=1 Tax=Thermosynechococcus sp. TaxID=2814275 RepID=UPI0039188757
MTAIELEPEVAHQDQVTIEQLANLVLKAGVCFPPLVVRRLGDRLACHRFKLLSGHLQYYAAQKANLREINALILEECDTSEIEDAILRQIRLHYLNSEMTEEQKEEHPKESLALVSNENPIETSHLLPSQVSPSPAANQNQLDLQLRLLNEGTEEQIREWFKKAGFSSNSRERYLECILSYRRQNRFETLGDLRKCCSRMQLKTLEKLENCPVPASFFH